MIFMSVILVFCRKVSYPYSVIALRSIPKRSAMKGTFIFGEA